MLCVMPPLPPLVGQSLSGRHSRLAGTGCAPLVIGDDHFVGKRHDRDLLLNIVFDIGQGQNAVFTGKAYGTASCACAACSADAMDVVLGVLWEVVVDDMRHSLDMQP